jgi:osmotically-inducible protein OsmY
MPCVPLIVTGAIAILTIPGCGANTSTRERQPDPPTRVEAVVQQQAGSSRQNPVDMGIERDLKLAIAHDAELRVRQINFAVADGDVSVTGTVKTEEERTRINDLAMRIGGVKSVANALRVAE